MFKLVLGGIALVETLHPKQYMRVLTRLSYDYEGDPPTAKPWVVKVAQLEGVLLLGAIVWSTLKRDWSCGALGRSSSNDAEGDTADSDAAEADGNDDE